MVEELPARLVERMCRGDEAAFERVLDRHLEQITHYVRRMMHDSPEAEDIVQETFIRLWRSRGRFEAGRVKLSTWLHRIAHNLCVDHFRRRRNREAVEPEVASAAGPESDYETETRSRRVHAALLSLSERQRSAIVLCHYQGLSNRDAARILALSVDALESLLRRARAKLKALLEEESPEK